MQPLVIESLVSAKSASSTSSSSTYTFVSKAAFIGIWLTGPYTYDTTPPPLDQIPVFDSEPRDHVVSYRRRRSRISMQASTLPLIPIRFIVDPDT